MKTKRPNRYRFLYLVRHGEYEHSDEKLHGQLTAKGIEQAEHTANYIRSFPISAIHCSTMSRAEQTAQIIRDAAFTNIELRRSWLLRERIFPGWMPMDEVSAGFRGSDELLERIAGRFLRPARSETHELVVCHGNLIRAIVTRVLGCPVDHWTNMVIHNLSITRVCTFGNKGPRLISFNEFGHLPEDTRTP